jgi:hypothetical protein
VPLTLIAAVVARRVSVRMFGASLPGRQILKEQMLYPT